MDPYNAPDNIYWTFGSAAQAIEAFIGFITAGFFFVYDRMDKYIESDETLEEVYSDIRGQYYKRLKTLLILTGFSIIFSLIVVYINA
jgi:hypothetical protein